MSDSVRPMTLLRVESWVFLFLLFLIPTASSQYYNVLYLKVGTNAADRFGSSTSGMEDVNGDGFPDFIIGAPGNADSAYVFSGATGDALFRKGSSPNKNHDFGSAVALIGDISPITPDGKSEFIVGAPYYDTTGFDRDGAVNIFSGTGSLVKRYFGSGLSDRDLFGFSVAKAGDVDADGKSDFIVGSPGYNAFAQTDNGRVVVFSGDLVSSFSYLTKEGASGDQLGYSVSSAGDVNADGKADILVGAPYAGSTDAGAAYVYSGADGNLLFTKLGSAANDHFGFSVANAGDVNGDGRPDFIVGAPHVGSTDAGAAYVYSGLNGNLLYTKTGAADGDNFGNSVAGRGDISGDGIPDFLVGATKADSGGTTDAGAAYVYSGQNGALLFDKFGRSNANNLGHSVYAIGDITGNGKSGFIIGRPLPADTNGSAFVYVNCPKAKGDMNGINGITAADGVCLQQCVYNGTSSCGCDRCYADMDCNGTLSPADVVILQNLIYYGTPPPC